MDQKDLNLKISNTKKPANLSDEEWQTALRKQFGSLNTYTITNIGSGLVYSDYKVINSQTKGNYKVALRSKDNTHNFCSCVDFKINQLGTCKHIEAVLKNINNNNELKPLLEVEYEPTYTSVYVDYKEGRKIKIRVGNDYKEEYTQLANEYFDEELKLKASSIERFEIFLQSARKISNLFRCYDDALEYVLDLREKHYRIGLIDKLNLSELFSLKQNLYPYQQEGVIYAAKRGRCIIADEFGLGKGTQAIAWTNILNQHLKVNDIIVVCPTALKLNWKSEFEKFTNLEVLIVDGPAEKRKHLYQNDKSAVKIVSYNVATSDWELINQADPDAIILDEAQRIKTWKSKVSQAVKKIKTPYCLVLSSTPIQNNLDELYNLVQFVNPYLLGTLNGFQKKYTNRDAEGKIISYNNLSELADKVNKIILRRNRNDVSVQIPNRIEKNLILPLQPEQIQLQNKIKENIQLLISKYKRANYLSSIDKQRLFNHYKELKKVANSTYLINHLNNHQSKDDELQFILSELKETKLNKIVFVSSSNEMLALIEKTVNASDLNYFHIKQNFNSQKIHKLLVEFNQTREQSVLLLDDSHIDSIELNHVDVLVNIDLPQVHLNEERKNHIFRLSKSNKQFVLNLISADSIEETLFQNNLLEQFDDKVVSNENAFSQFIQQLISFGFSDNNFTEEYPEKTEIENFESRQLTIFEQTSSKEVDKYIVQESGNIFLKLPVDSKEQAEHVYNFLHNLFNTFKNHD